MEDVIFGGTKIRKPLGYAEVTLRLDNKDRSLACDSDEVAVTRRYYRSGESEYRLNAEAVRLRDIHELFMDTGLGRDGYSLVSQGRVADLISSKSNQRREMLEEAAGISQKRLAEIIGVDPVPHIPVRNFIAPRGLDLTHYNYIIMDGRYYCFLYIKGNGSSVQIQVCRKDLEKSKEII